MAGARKDYKNFEQTQDDFKKQKSRILSSGGESSADKNLKRHRDDGLFGRPQNAAYDMFVCCTGSLSKP
jgi:TnpA family transposase